MAGVVSEITIGSSELYIAPSGTALPTLTGAASDFSGFQNPGFTKGGIEFDFTSTFKDHNVDERLAPVKKTITALKLIVMATLVQPTFQNLTYAMAAATLVAADILTIGSPEVAPEWVVGWRGPSASGGTMSALVWRVISIGAVKAHFQRKEMVEVPAQFEALSDSNQGVLQDLAYYQDFPSVPFVLAV